MKAYIKEISDKYQKIPVPAEAKQNNEVQYTQPASLDVEISYPGALQLIDLLVTFDKLLFHLTELWYAVVIDDAEYYRVKTDARTRLKDDEKKVESLVRKALDRAIADSKKHEEDVQVEAGIASLAAAAAKKSPANGRGGRRTKATEAAISPAEPGEVERAPGPGDDTVKPGEETFSPFSADSEKTAAAATS